MDRVLNQPFVSEAYDRLMAAQAAYVQQPVVDPIDTGSALRAARAELGLTQAALADKLGLSGPAVSNMEGGADNIPGRTDLAVRYLLVEHRR